MLRLLKEKLMPERPNPNGHGGVRSLASSQR